jgi:phosphoadenosine phosphosulfate reductase
MIAEDKELCCHLLKTETLRSVIDKYEIDYVFLARGLDSTEINDISFVNEEIKSVNPLRKFSKKDIWDYIKKYNLPYCSLYLDNYKKIMCSRCTQVTFDKKSGKNEILREKNDVAKKLKALGYV